MQMLLDMSAAFDSIDLDMSAAFDSIDHDTLLQRLHVLNGVIINWFASYLSSWL